MADPTVKVHILHGDDEHAMTVQVEALRGAVGASDPSMADLNTARLDGRSASLDEMVRAVQVMPFLAARRLVVLTEPLARLNTAEEQQRFQGLLASAPESSLVVVLLATPKENRSAKAKDEALIAWAAKAGPAVATQLLGLPRGERMTDWIIDQARRSGGQFKRDAAGLLAEMLGSDTRLAATEIEKLLLYVNFARPVDVEDVERLSVRSAQANIFDMVDAMGGRNSPQALKLLEQLLEEQDALAIFGMITRQFRLLLLARTALQDGVSGEAALSQVLGTPPFVARKIMNQAKQFNLPSLEAIYRRLLEIDRDSKTGVMDGDLSLCLLVAGLSRLPR